MTVTTILGGTNADMTTLLGSALDDVFSPESSNLFIDALSGNDRVQTNSAVEQLKIELDEGNDNIVFNAEVLSSTLYLGLGNDNVTLADFSGSIYGGVGEDSIYLSSLRTITDSLIRGEGGNDVVRLTEIYRTIISLNSDDDYILISDMVDASQIYGGRQQDTITIVGKASNSLIRGDANDDTIAVSGELNNAIIHGNAENDTLDISSDDVSSSTVYGGKGADLINISSDSINVIGGKGNDDINVTSNKNHTINGGEGEDTIDSSSTKSILVDGGSDKDTITLTGIADVGNIHTINGGTGGDSISGSSGNEFMDGGTKDDGKDTLISGGGDDTIYGRAGNDLIMLEAGSSAGEVRVQAGSGDDIIEVAIDEITLTDNIKGEKGNDTIAFVGTAADFNMWVPNTVEEKAFDSIYTVETLGFGTVNSTYTVAGTKTINLSNKVQSSGILTIDASNARGFGDDVLEVNTFQFSSSANLTFIGSDDKDVNVNFTGGSGDDTLTTGKITEDAGDTLTGGLGVDTFIIVATDTAAVISDLGTGGSDVIVVNDIAEGVTATVTTNYTATSDTNNNKTDFSKVILNAEEGVNIDMIAASGTFGFTINGGTASATLQGSSFSDSITGNSRVDSLIGNGGNDTIEGGGGADIINTGKGNGYVKDAGIGADIITHNLGNSVVVQNTGTDTVTLTATSPGAYVVATAGGERTVDATTSTASIALDGSGAALNKVTYTGGSGDDSITGGSLGDALSGNAGNDTITGGLGIDTITLGDGANTIVFTGGLTTDIISGFTSNDIGSFDLSELEKDDAVEDGETLNFANGGGTSVLASDSISMQTVGGAITLAATTNVLNYTKAAVQNAAALETALEDGGGIITTFNTLAENSAFIIQYEDSDTNRYSYAIAHLEDAGVAGAAKIAAWEVTDIATTNLTTAFTSSQFIFIS